MQKKQVIEKTGEWTEWTIIPSGYLLVGGLEHEFYFPIQLGMSSSQLTNSIIF